MAIKRVIYELDDSTDLNPTTGATIQNLSPDKDFLSNQTKSLETYKDSEISKSDKIDNLKPLIGRTIPDLILFSDEEIRRNFLSGMIDSDGSVKRTKKDLLKNRKR